MVGIKIKFMALYRVYMATLNALRAARNVIDNDDKDQRRHLDLMRELEIAYNELKESHENWQQYADGVLKELLNEDGREVRDVS